MIDVTLVFLLKENFVYLAKKAKGKFGGELFNGYGGKVAQNESISQCAIRETFEESGVIIEEKNLEKVAILDFYFPDVDASKGWNQRAHVFFVRTWKGIPKKSDEMQEPHLFSIDNLPNEMWAADKEWLKEVFSGMKIRAKIYFVGKGESFKPFISEKVNSFE